MRRDHREQFLRAGARGEHLPVRSVRRQAVAAFGGAHDRAAALHDFGRSRHAFHRLVQVLIQRIAGVRREHHVEGRAHLAHGVALRRGARRAMLGEQLSGKDGGDLLRAVQRHVHGEVDAGHSRNLAHVVVDRIPFGDAPRRHRMTDAHGVVQREHGLQARQSRRDHLRAAAEAGKEMRLDESGRNAHVGVQPQAIEVHLDARRRVAGVDESRSVAAIVIDNAVLPHDVAAEHRVDFRGRVAAMRAGRDQDRDVARADVRHLFEERLEHLAARLRAGDVADGNRDAAAAVGELAERRRGERRAERCDERGVRIADRGAEHRLDDRDAVIGEVDLETVDAVIEPDAHTAPSVARQTVFRHAGVRSVRL